MTADAAPPPDLTLDACAALRADVAAQHASQSASAEAAPGGAVTSAHDLPARGAPGSSATPGPTPGAAAREAAWLLIVTSIERGAELDARRRPAHFRRARAVWDDAAGALGGDDYAEIGARLARWRSPDPTLPLVRRLLWAVEQPEAAGYTRLALAGYTALARLVPHGDVRRGYVVAQSARAVRTLGDTQGAIDRYSLSERLGGVHRDRWLRVRSAIGLGATYYHIGNYPAARAVLHGVLKKGAPDARFTAAAHHGLVLSAMAARDWETALHHGWHLLRAAQDGSASRIDALLLMAGLCRRIGRYRAAVSAAEAALRIGVRPDDPMIAHKIVLDVALATADEGLAREHSTKLRKLLHTGAGPFENAKCMHTLALVEERWGELGRAREDATQAFALARLHKFNELAFEIEPTVDRVHAARPVERASHLHVAYTPPPERAVELSPQAHRIVNRIADLEVGERQLAAAGS